jgi:hypothetical protein
MNTKLGVFLSAILPCNVPESFRKSILFAPNSLLLIVVFTTLASKCAIHERLEHMKSEDIIGSLLESLELLIQAKKAAM